MCYSPQSNRQDYLNCYYCGKPALLLWKPEAYSPTTTCMLRLCWKFEERIESMEVRSKTCWTILGCLFLGYGLSSLIHPTVKEKSSGIRELEKYDLNYSELKCVIPEEQCRVQVKSRSFPMGHFRYLRQFWGCWWLKSVFGR